MVDGEDTKQQLHSIQKISPREKAVKLSPRQNSPNYALYALCACVCARVCEYAHHAPHCIIP